MSNFSWFCPYDSLSLLCFVSFLNAISIIIQYDFSILPHSDHIWMRATYGSEWNTKHAGYPQEVDTSFRVEVV